MQIRVAHLMKKWEELNRDVLELTKLKNRIADNREYSEFLKESIQLEIDKLNEYKDKLLNLSVENPPSRMENKKTSSQAQSDSQILMEKETNYRQELSRKQEPPPQSKNKLKSERPVYKY